MIRKATITALLTLMSLPAMAATNPSETKPRDFVFKYHYQGQNLEVRRQTKSWEEAYEQAAKTCFQHFKNAHGGHLSEDQGLDIIDVCANPRG